MAEDGKKGVDMSKSENPDLILSLIHISEPTRQAEISYAVFCLKKKKNKKKEKKKKKRHTTQ